MRYKILFIFLLLWPFWLFGWDWENYALKKEPRPPVKIRRVWAVDTAKGHRLRLVSGISPLIAGDLVIQGNAIDGLKAYAKSDGRKIWDFPIPSGAAGSPARHEGNLYFGGADGFFYSLKLKTGQLNWKFWTGSENSGPPLIQDGFVYWTALNQKLYALDLKGKARWLYSGPSLPKGFFVRGRPRPAIYKNWIYTGFYDGSLVALNRRTGRLKWKISLAPSHAISEDLALKGNCLFAPAHNFYLFCLNPLSGKARWKARGGSASYLDGGLIYQFYGGELLALNKSNGRLIWKKKMEDVPISPSVLKNYLIYGFPSKGRLALARAADGKVLAEHKFGRGLSAPVTADPQSNEIYFLSADGYLHKLIVLEKL